jgi:hypothetical protein
MTSCCFTSRWEATLYPRFANLTFEKASRMLGSKGGWPRENPPEERRVETAENIPDTFDARQQWPGAIHAIRNQVCDVLIKTPPPGI